MYFKHLQKPVKHHTHQSLTIHVFKIFQIIFQYFYVINFLLKDFTDQSFMVSDNPWSVSVRPSKLFYNETVRLEIPGTSHIEVI